MDLVPCLSVINPNPRKLPGPELLHNLVTLACSSEALNHLENGTRTSYSYHDLHHQADAIASRLTRVDGYRDGSFVVPVLMEQSPTLYTVLLAILKSGGAFCPLNIDAPPERVRFIFQDVSAKAVVVSRQLAAKIPADCSAEIVIAEDAAVSLPSPTSFRNCISSDLAYVMYTSGSTGTPKGVGLSHEAATQALLAHDRHIPSFSRFLQFAAPTFDVSVFEIFFPLIRGATLVSVNRSQLLDDLPGAIRDMQVDACELTPTVAGSLLKTRDSVPSLKLLLTIGEMLTEPVVRQFGGDNEKESILWAMYGPTEATIHCTLQTSMKAKSSVRNIGIPLDTVSCYVLRPPPEDDELASFEILPQGEVGELAVGGHQLAVGYLNRPEQTTAAFISTPYGRLYRTGDKARILEDGTLECLGRLSDGQVKLRGQRIEVGEVQEAILRTPGCHGAVVVVHESILVAFCAVDEDVLEDAILTHCQRWLPRFMVPGEIVLSSTFPKLPSGKVDRRKLVTDFQQGKEDSITASIQSDSGNMIPQEFIMVITQILQSQITSQTKLSSAGVDSLKAIQIASELRSECFNVDASMVLKSKTVTDLWLASEAAADAPRTIADISKLHLSEPIFNENPILYSFRESIQDIIPCTPLQSAMLLETARNPNTYWNEVELELEAGTAAVLSACKKVIKANEILRTGFLQWQDGFMSVVFDSLDPSRIEVLADFHASSAWQEEDLLQPLRIQIKQHTAHPHSRSQLLLQIHHAVFDGWSIDMIIADLSTLIKGQEPGKRPQFRDIATFYETSTTLPTKVYSESFWADHLEGWTKDSFPKFAVTSETDRKPLSVFDSIGITDTDVDAVAKSLTCSHQTLFQAAWTIVWGGILGSDDIVLGTVVSGRTIPVSNVQKIMGPCIASLPLRSNLERMTDASHLINHLHSVNRSILEHSHIALSDIRRFTELQPNDHLYDVLFVYQQSIESAKSTLSPVRQVRHMDYLETRLLVEITPVDEGFEVQLTGHRSSINPDILRCLVRQFKMVFQRLIKDPYSSFNALKRECTDNLSIYNAIPTSYSGPADLATLFEASVQRAPDSNALCFVESGMAEGLSKTFMTYGELNSLSNRIAHLLLSSGMGTRQVVAVVMEKSPIMYASILSIVKAGCAYLPILPTTPIERVRDTFVQAKIRHCLVDETSSLALKVIGQVHFINLSSTKLLDFQDHDLLIPPDPSRLAYVIYTSGTTGTPKGVAVTQLNITSNIHHLNTVYPRSEENQPRLLQACSQAFDVSAFEIFYAWHAGMCLCAGTNDTIFEDLEYAIQQMGITHLSLTPTVASLVNPINIPSVEFLVTAGEPLTSAVRDQWGSLLWQGYGPSETTNICSVKQMHRDMPVEHLGWVFPNTSVFVLGLRTYDPVPMGWVGEFCYGGDQIAHGYLNMPRRTEESFIIHPKYGRIYRSGDFGRMLPDGSLVIIGRIDDQVKLRGQRIETGEISSVITSTKMASSAVAILGKRNDAASNQLVAFYVLPDDTPGDGVLDIDLSATRSLFSALQSRLPAYMVPSYVIPIARIPLTSSGKLHRRRLQDWFIDLPSSYLEAAAMSGDQSHDGDNWSPTELVIASAIADMTDIPLVEISRWSSFVNYGVDSVTAIDLSTRMRARLGRRVAISNILLHPTISQLGQFLDQDSIPTDHSQDKDFFPTDYLDSVRSQFALISTDVDAIYPCTPLQEAMLSGASKSYYNRTMLRLRISSSEMQKHWVEMAKRHEILRTCFISTQFSERSIAQVVLRHWTIPWRTFDVITPSFDAVVNEHLGMLPDPINSKIPPVSLGVINYRDSVFLSFICHHALYDGVAIDNLWKEVEALANGVSLPPPISYEPFLRKMVKLPRDTESFWKQMMRDFHRPSLFANPSNKSVDQAVARKSLAIPLNVLQARVRQHGLSLLSLCQGAWAHTLGVAYSSQDVCFGNVVSGRTVDVEGVEQLMAPCFNTIPIRVDLSSKTHGIDVLKNLQELNSALLPYQFTPLRVIQKLADHQRRGLFETLLLLQKPLSEMDDRVWILESDSGDMDVPMVCEVVPCPSLDAAVVNMHYDMNIVDPATASLLLKIFAFMLEHIINTPFSSIPNRESLPTHLSQPLEMVKVRVERLLPVKGEEPSEEAWTETEARIRKVMSDLSQKPQSAISRHTTIHQIGLDSINAVQIATILRGNGLSVSTSDVIEYSSCSKLASHLEASLPRENGPRGLFDLEEFARDVASQVTPNLVQSEDVEAILPCTPMQNAMLTANLQSGGQHYFNRLKFVVNGEIDAKDIAHGWGRLAAGHPMLRTSFVRISQKHTAFAMIRRREPHMSQALTIGANGDSSETLAKLEERIRRKLVTDPEFSPWHVLVQRSGNSLSFVLLIHHALYDAHSLEDLLSCLSEVIQGRDLPVISRVEPGLTDIMTKSFNVQPEAERFWVEASSQVVVNPFPIMTPLKETETKLLVESGSLSMSFSELQLATQEIGVSVQAAMQATWARILASYLGEQSVVFGVTLSGRTNEFTKDAPFPCVVTLPIIASNTASNTKILNTMMGYNSDIHKFQSLPLSQIQKWLGHPGNRIFDTLISYRRTERSSEGPRILELIEDDAVVDYPISLDIAANGDDVHVTITFSPAILPREQARVIHQQFDAILSHMVLHPEGVENDLYREVPELFAILPQIAPVMDSPVQLLHQLVEKQALENPESIALEFVDSLHTADGLSSRSWSFEVLNQRGNQVANLLQGKAIEGSIVAVHFNKSPEAYFSILGILKAGCSFVALDTTAPESRKQYILEDSAAPCILCGPDDILDFVPDGVQALCIEELHLRTLPSDARGLDETFTPSATCYCLYTSGTTGTPKGCEISHDNAVQAMMAFQDLFKGHWDHESRWLQFAALHFDVSVLEQYWTWSVGMTVVAATKDLILDDLTGTINKLGITHIDLTPSLARLTHPDDVPSLCRGVFITGGESLNQEVLDAWGSKAVIYNAYGPTEATIGVTMFQRVPTNGRPSNIGKQFPNVGSYVFQPGTEIPVMRGGVGELCVAGKLVGKGYLRRPELTAECFPTLSQFKDRVYRTGDLVRVLHDGCFDFLGRADDQIKLRGQRLEIGEINHVIRSAPEIYDAATIVTSRESKDKSVLVSFIVAQSADGLDDIKVLPSKNGLASKAQQACRDRLPGYMVPTYFLELPRIPLSINNKADVKELKRLFHDLSRDELTALVNTSTSALSAPDSETLKVIIEVLATFSASDQSEISAQTSVFDLGVDSISALRLSSLLRDCGLLDASPIKILRNPCIEDLARSLSLEDTLKTQKTKQRESLQKMQAFSHRYTPMVCRLLGITSSEVEYICPCSPLQQAIISRSLVLADKAAYFNTFQLNLSSDLDLDQFHRSWDSLVSSESILRTVFLETTTGHAQVSIKKHEAPWTELKLKTEEDATEYLEMQFRDWVTQNDKNIILPLQFFLVETPGVTKLHIHIFHAIYDGNSLNLMLARVASLMREVPAPSAPSFLQALSSGPLANFDDCRPFWEEHFRKWTAPVHLSVSSSGLNQTIKCSRSLPWITIADVRQTQNVTLQAVLLALWISVLQQHHKSANTGIIVSGRSIDLPGIENTIGPLFNTLPFSSNASSNMTWSDLIQSCHKFGTTVLPFQHVPLHSIQKWCTKGRPAFDTLFALQVETSDAQSEESLWEVKDGHSYADYPLAVEFTSTHDRRLLVSLVAQGDTSNKSALESTLDQLQKHLHLLAADPNQPVPQQDSAANPHRSTTISENHIDDQPHDFVWTDIAEILRRELSSFADVKQAEITEHTTILELGIDSIDVIKLSLKLKRQNIALSASKLMRQGTIAKMLPVATVLSSDSAEAQADEGLAKVKPQLDFYAKMRGIDMSSVEKLLPATPLQESMVASMLESDFEWYYNHDVLEIREDVEMSQLKAAWEDIVRALPILRTGFLEVLDPELHMTSCQVIRKKLSPWREDVVGGAIEDSRKIFERSEARARESRGEDDLLQLSSLTVGPKRYLIISIAHALYDGWSLGLMYRELQKSYNGMAPATSDVEIFLGKAFHSISDESQNYWCDYLRKATPTKIPRLVAPLSSESTVYRAERPLSVDVSTVLDFCKKNSVSLHAFSQACWASVLASITGQLEVSFGVVLSGRDFADAEDLVFPTMNTVISRYFLHGTATNFVRYIEDSIGDSREHQHFPLRKALTAAKTSSDALFNSLFLFQKSSDIEDTAGILCSVGGKFSTEYPVCVEAEITGRRLVWRTACHSGYGSESTALSLLDAIDEVAKYFVNCPGSEIFSFVQNKVSICGMAPTTINSGHDSDEIAPEIQGHTGEWDETTSVIRDVLSQISGIPITDIHLSSTVYHLGLDSITTLKVSAELRRRRLKISARDLLSATSVSHMALLSQRSETARPQVAAKSEWNLPASIVMEQLLEQEGLVAEAVERVLPALPVQVYMLTTWKHTQGELFYPEFAYLLARPCSSDAIETAWNLVVNSTPMLRTCFVATSEPCLPVLQVILKKNTRLERRPMVSLKTKWDDAQNAWVLLLRIHHALYDGVSLPVIMQKLAHAITTGQTSDDGVDITPWVNFTTNPTLDASLESRQRFWTTYLSGCPQTTQSAELRTDYPIERVSYIERSALPDATLLRLKAVQNGVSVQSLFLAAYAKLLWRREAGNSHHDANDINSPSPAPVVLGIYLANRTGMHDEDELPASFVRLNIVPLKVNAWRGGLLDVASAIQADLGKITASGRADVGLWEIDAWTGVKISSFVNFLSTPNAGEGTAAESTLSVIENEALNAVPPEEIHQVGDITVKNSFLPSIDVEASLRNDGLDVGVFGPGNLLNDSHDAARLVAEIVTSLKEET